jgi:CheY-like chemotaxis protein
LLRIKDGLGAVLLKLLPALPIYREATRENNVKILLVEDSKPIRRENETALHNAGYEVICAVDGESAVRFAQDQKPDLILLDMILPKMSGPEVLRHLKSDPLTAEIPVVVLSSLSEKNREKLLEEGADEYLEKNALMPGRGINLLPQVLETVICRINRKRGIGFSNIPLHE